jgi:hypothetical protein
MGDRWSLRRKVNRNSGRMPLRRSALLRERSGPGYSTEAERISQYGRARRSAVELCPHGAEASSALV